MRLKSPQRRLVLGGACLLAALPPPAHALGKTLRVVTSHLPPLVNEDGGAEPGALREVVDELCKRVALAPEFQFVPWQRAVFLAGRLRATTIFPLTRITARERQFRWLVPLYEVKYVFLAPRGRAFDVHNAGNMKDMRITLICGSALKTVLVELGYKKLVEANSVDEVHRFMVAGIADAAFGELSIVRNALRTRVAEDDFDVGTPISRTDAWLAGSLDFTDADAGRFQRAMQDMKADGSYFAILKKYRLG